MLYFNIKTIFKGKLLKNSPKTTPCIAMLLSFLTGLSGRMYFCNWEFSHNFVKDLLWLERKVFNYSMTLNILML